MQETQTLFECRKNTTIKATQETHKNQNTKSGTGPTWHRAGGVLTERF